MISQHLELTPFQRQICYFYCHGCGYKYIAGLLGITRDTVRDTIRKISIHFGCAANHHLISVLIANGYIEVTPQSLYVVYTIRRYHDLSFG